MQPELKTGPWFLSDLKSVPKNGLKVFSCFHCGGGSTMGYKLAGYEVLGGVEIDPQMMGIYRANHNPKHSYLMGVQEFRNIPDEKLPAELFELDILDGSPPCSSFSMAGNREKNWGDEKKFREGQANQVLDDLFFDFISIAEKLKPKVVVAENVKGLVMGSAKGYVKQIFKAFEKAGYECQLFLLNGSMMGVPQRRERVFFIARRKDLPWPKLSLSFNEPLIPFSAIKSVNETKSNLTEHETMLWNGKIASDKNFGTVNERLRGKVTQFNTAFVHDNEVLSTITAGGKTILHSLPRSMTSEETILGQTFPNDYNFGKAGVRYVCGMSVAPFMMQRIADQIERQWFKIL